LTKRKRKGDDEQEGQQEPFLWTIGGHAGPSGEEGGTGWLELPDCFNNYGGPPKEKPRARSSPSPREDLPEPDSILLEQVLEPRARRPARALSPSAGVGGLDTSQLDPVKLKEPVFERPKGGGTGTTGKEQGDSTRGAPQGHKALQTAKLERNGGAGRG
jgi:hypothetical protein